ncbi:unnamed protein product [Blepharisma stoltei]|uniref:Uncharacterized protein n=1 Tax=Blepharisma stoltei TaxID=1481888 RepID=A0AAU9K3U0_9CILI|nr:unnamed protein product [Blepharisma stoltei]
MADLIFVPKIGLIKNNHSSISRTRLWVPPVVTRISSVPKLRLKEPFSKSRKPSLAKIPIISHHRSTSTYEKQPSRSNSVLRSSVISERKTSQSRTVHNSISFVNLEGFKKFIRANSQSSLVHDITTSRKSLKTMNKIFNKLENVQMYLK